MEWMYTQWHSVLASYVIGPTACTVLSIYNNLQVAVKHLRRAYIVCLMIFVTYSECNSPFHTVLSDVIESCGGSTELITMLNRFGICSSVDTLKHVIHSVYPLIRKMLVLGAC